MCKRITSQIHDLVQSRLSVFIPPQPISLKPITIFFSHLRLGLINSPFLSNIQTKILHALLPMRATCPVHLILLILFLLIISYEKYTLRSSSKTSSRHSSCVQAFSSAFCSQTPSSTPCTNNKKAESLMKHLTFLPRTQHKLQYEQDVPERDSQSLPSF
jgi:hypothetical protein